VVIFTSNSIIYVDQSSRKVFLPVNGWPPRVSDLPMPTLSAEEQQRNLELEGCRSAFIDERTFIVVLRDGTVYPVEVTIDGKTVSRLSMMPALVQTTIPSLLKKINNDYVLIGSTVSS
jgi:cleavage and polyadenylation specificity factor subunit 1